MIPLCLDFLLTLWSIALTGADGEQKVGHQATRRTEHIIPKEALAKGEYTIIIEVTCNVMLGAGREAAPWNAPDVSRGSSLPSV